MLNNSAEGGKFTSMQAKTAAANKENKPLNLSLTKPFANLEARMIATKSGGVTSASNARQHAQTLHHSVHSISGSQQQMGPQLQKDRNNKPSSQSSGTQLHKNRLAAPEIISNAAQMQHNPSQ